MFFYRKICNQNAMMTTSIGYEANGHKTINSKCKWETNGQNEFLSKYQFVIKLFTTKIKYLSLITSKIIKKKIIYLLLKQIPSCTLLLSWCLNAHKYHWMVKIHLVDFLYSFSSIFFSDYTIWKYSLCLKLICIWVSRHFP